MVQYHESRDGGNWRGFRRASGNRHLHLERNIGWPGGAVSEAGRTLSGTRHASPGSAFFLVLEAQQFPEPFITPFNKEHATREHVVRGCACAYYKFFTQRHEKQNFACRSQCRCFGSCPLTQNSMPVL